MVSSKTKNGIIYLIPHMISYMISYIRSNICRSVNWMIKSNIEGQSLLYFFIIDQQWNTLFSQKSILMMYAIEEIFANSRSALSLTCQTNPLKEQWYSELITWPTLAVSSKWSRWQRWWCTNHFLFFPFPWGWRIENGRLRMKNWEWVHEDGRLSMKDWSLRVQDWGLRTEGISLRIENYE